MHCVHILTLLVIFATVGDSARILAAIPTPAYSHQYFFQSLWRELAIRGHELVVLTTNPTRENITTLKEIDMGSAYKIFHAPENIIDVNANPLEAHLYFMEAFCKFSLHELELPQVRQVIDNPAEHFDLVMVEYLYPFFMGLGHRFKAPIIGVSSMDVGNDDHYFMGNLAHAVSFPGILIATQMNLSFKERLLSFFFEHMIFLWSGELVTNINKVNAQYFGADCPSYNDLMQNVDMLFINSNPLYSPLRPLSPSTISLGGGLHLHEPKPLPAELKTFLDESRKGVIYLNLGSKVKSNNLPQKTLDTLIETFSQLPYNVLWKFEDDHLQFKPKNVKIMNWVPQQDVLRHENIKLFITQAGRHSLEEALFAHVPLIVMPFFGDQQGNSARVISKGVALQLDYRALTVDELTLSINEVINNPMYKKNMRVLASQVLDQPMRPLERAVWWTEYIIRHKSGKHLKGPTIPMFHHMCIDIWAVLITCLVVLVFTFYKCYLIVLFLFKKYVSHTIMKFKLKLN